MSNVKETNYEHYKDEIIKVMFSNNMCDFKKEYILKNNDCSGTHCAECDKKIVPEWLETPYEEPKIEIDWSKVPVDTPVLVRDYESDNYEKRHFNYYEAENTRPFICFADGKSSYTSTSVKHWSYCELAREEDVEKYKK